LVIVHAVPIMNPQHNGVNNGEYVEKMMLLNRLK